MAKPSMQTEANYNNIAQGTSIVGDIKSVGDLKIDGRIKGTVNVQGKVVIGKEGVVEGEIICREAQISGKVIGRINTSELLMLKATVEVQGDIVTKTLGIEPGAVLVGNCNCRIQQTNAPKGSNIAKK